ncbi:TonB-linked outer membrane protein, SusC/RagA family [Cyclobacterium xiamenense]|uniref:TonB-linked outer membrane protein, SusC/RagA family n=1 Tax=Cyclobacterium xiamenense TaxID=1297121 RepID=A0A1H6TMG0_9BACT|nr:TonB-dependent receptor [Cyclobacterium xiamenense]SEI81259.1 TonB-linked outer membrane protein, SusC/RagA family [Cyclobacterium xiamenense]
MKSKTTKSNLAMAVLLSGSLLHFGLSAEEMPDPWTYVRPFAAFTAADPNGDVRYITVTGTVTDQDGIPIPGATVVIEGTTTGTVTDIQGQFSIEADQGDVLQISFIGYQTQRIPLENQTQLSVVLQEDQSDLEEVVVVGYGTQRKSDLTGAISSISSKDLQETPAGNFLEQSQGRLAGVDIVRANGSPGAPVQIRIRGNRSINASNEPLYVIDGIPTSANINDFNPNDIESMEVLKDASAVAIYGSRGANGVVLITTKRGKTGKAVVSYDGYYGVKQPVQDLNLMDGREFAAYSRISRGHAGDDPSFDANFFAPLEIENLQAGRFTDWLDLAIQSGSQQDHQVSVSGGTDKINYYVSGSFFSEDGYIPGTDFERTAVRVNLESQLTDKLKLGVSATVSVSERNQMSNAPYNNSLGYSPLVGPTDAEGNFLAFPNPREGLLANPLLNYQPYQYVDETRRHRIFANIYGEYQFNEYLKLRVNYGPDFNLSRRGTYTGLLEGNINRGSVRNDMDFSYTQENILSYDRSFGKHALNLVGLFSIQTARFEESSLSGQDIPIEKSLFYDLGSSSTITGIGSSLGEWGLMSYMGRVNYRYDDKFLFTLTGRADGSSRLAEGNKWAFFPAFSAGYILTEEEFLQGGQVSFLKLRAGYGEVGNTAIDPFQTLGGLARSTYIFGTNAGFGYRNNLIPNPDLRWEISKTVNIGLDYGLFEDRINGSLEYYVTNTSDLLLNRLLPITSGYNSVLQNIGSTRNSGWELTANANVVNRPSGFRWDVNLNVFSNREQITELFEGQRDDVGNRWFIGEPINVFYSFDQAGIWQTSEADLAADQGQAPGDIRIRDVNGRGSDGELTDQPDGQINADDRRVLGSTVPNWSGGLTNRVSFKGFDLSVLVHARMGQMLRSDYHNLGGNNWQGRYNSINLDYWTTDNPTNAFPRPNAGEAPLYSDAVRYFDGSFIKIRNIALGYNFKSSWISKLGMSSARIYSTVNNALIFSPYTTVDPETSNGIVGEGSPLTTATYIFGLNLKF